ncbi:hypothetical protein TeGR_g15261 [Tetraparma gracilis]|uniref:Uncharacterized protein n=1 Tax=Tetraparma gracilis TaxID=2962635 RepID=A0ABQ6MMU0_9STRA|nr:hypothetical protein TeGR_g15261 [Tetraparma gracilis]
MPLFVPPGTDLSFPSYPPALSLLLSHLLHHPQPTEFGFLPLLAPESPAPTPASFDDADPERMFTKVTEPSLPDFAALGVDISSLGPLIASVRATHARARSSSAAPEERTFFSSLALLLFCPDTHSAWGDRRRFLLSLPPRQLVPALRGELALLELQGTREGGAKASAAWAHRMWAVRRLREDAPEPDPPDPPATPDPPTTPSPPTTPDPLLASELAHTLSVVQRIPKHYYAWTHRASLLSLFSPLPPALLTSELSLAASHLAANPSDNSAVSHLAHVLSLLPPADRPAAAADLLPPLRSAIAVLPEHPTLHRGVRVALLFLLRGCDDGLFLSTLGEIEARLPGAPEHELGCAAWVAGTLRAEEGARSRHLLGKLRRRALELLVERGCGANDLWRMELEDELLEGGGEHEHLVADVGRDNAAFVMEAAEKGFDENGEEAALRTIMETPGLLSILEATLGARCASVLAKYRSRSAWSGRDIREVVEKLDAPHLQPTGILERLPGTHAAAFGLAALISNLEK